MGPYSSCAVMFSISGSAASAPRFTARRRSTNQVGGTTPSGSARRRTLDNWASGARMDGVDVGGATCRQPLKQLRVRFSSRIVSEPHVSGTRQTGQQRGIVSTWPTTCCRQSDDVNRRRRPVFIASLTTNRYLSS